MKAFGEQGAGAFVGPTAIAAEIRRQYRVVPIGGSPPDLREPLSGCRFVPRCPFAQPACSLDTAMSGNGAHQSACRRDSEADTLRTAALDPRTWQRSSSFAMS